MQKSIMRFSILLYSILVLSSCFDFNPFTNTTTTTVFETKFYPTQDVTTQGGSMSTVNWQTYSPQHSYALACSYSDVTRCFIQFSFSSIPANTAISRATLHLKSSISANIYLPHQVEVYLKNVMESWSEYSMTYNTMPSLGGVLSTKLISSLPENTWINFDITDAVKNWINNSAYNHGLGMVMTEYMSGYDYGYGTVTFWSKDSNSSPYIEIEY